MKTNNNKSNMEKAVAVGASIAALAAAGYFFFGPNSKKNIKKTRGWMVKMKGEVLEKIEAAKEVTEGEYNNIVDTVSKNYAYLGDNPDVGKLVKELKSHWKSISKSVLKTKTKKTTKK